MNASDNAADLIKDQAGEIATSRANVVWKTIAPAILLLFGVAAVIVIAKALPIFFNEKATPILRITLVIAAVSLAAAMTVRHRRQWVLPSIEMRRLIHEIRLARAPIDEFVKFNPGAHHELAAEVKLLLQDLRQQRQAIVELNDEISQRIAHRTSVLERTVASLRNQAVRDPLTGLYNRRMLDQLLPQLVAQIQTEHKTLTLIMIDMDYFKKLNDTLGHAAGDEMLKAVAQIIHSTIREVDFGFRYGGDEFVLLLPGCDGATSKRVSDRLQSLVSALGQTYKLSQPPCLSFGISTLAELTNPTGADLLKRADERLYEAKSKRVKPTAASPVPNSEPKAA